jgi:hypothetical protein
MLCALPCYGSWDSRAALVPTPEFLSGHLSAPSGSKERFGTTAAAVLETAALVAAADQDWGKDAVTAFLREQDIHQKVWGKLVAISRSINLHSLPPKELPASYTALYALVVMTPQELKAAESEGVIKSNASSRSILEWTKAFRLRGTGIEQEVPLTLVLRQDLTAEQHKDLMEALKEVADQFGAEVREGKGGVKQSELKAEARATRALQIEEDLMEEIGAVVLAAPENLKQQFGVTSAGDLFTGPRATFTGFFQNLVGKVEGAFWREYGRAYCLKIARDFNVTESRADRHQLKKRIEAASEKWSQEIEGFKAMTNQVIASYMTR